MPIQIPHYSQFVATTDKEKLRTHMAEIYLNEEEHFKYIKTVYPDFIDSLKKLKEEQH